MAFVIPAHFIGGILGVTLVKLLLVDALAKQLGGGWAGQALLPVIYHLQHDSSSTGLGWQVSAGRQAERPGGQTGSSRGGAGG